MNGSNFRQKTPGMLLALVFMTACVVPTAIPTLTPVSATGQPAACGPDDLVPVSVLRSTDHGATWTSLGDACMHDSTALPVDPTGFAIGDRIVLYFVDFRFLSQEVPQIIYRATSVDGVSFDKPRPVYTQTDTMVDPTVLPMPDGTFRLYAPSESGTISAVSSDGLAFVREDGVRNALGGMPGALLLPDNRVRMFVCGGGIFSYISDDGLNFTREDGMRISPPPGYALDNPQPIRLADGGYLMLYQIYDPATQGLPDAWKKDIHLASSTDGYNWTTNPAVIANGGTSTVIEKPDGTLFIYYGR
jgi:hypothetical protein